MIREEKEKKIEEFISCSNGSENYYKHSLTHYCYTDGVKYVAEIAGAYWLIDKILILTKSDKKFRGSIRFWILKVDIENKKGKLVCYYDKDIVIYEEEIEYTDFPLSEFKLWFDNEVLFLPSEY